MVDIKTWYSCRFNRPSKKGKYLLMVGRRHKTAGHTETGVIESYWNGHNWSLSDNRLIPMQWKYIQPNELEKYPDFMKNSRRVKIECLE